MITNTAIPVVSPPANIRCPSGTRRIVGGADRNDPCLSKKPLPSLTSDIRHLFVPEGDQRVHFRRPPRREVACQRGDAHQQQGGDHEGRRVGRANSEEQAPDQPRDLVVTANIPLLLSTVGRCRR
jgi:hypothetical protein